MSKSPHVLLLDYAQHNYERVARFRSIEYESRRELISSFLKMISASSILLASGWIVLVTGSSKVPVSDEILFACGLHIAVVGLCALTTFALILAHTFAKNCFDEIERRSGQIYVSVLIARDFGADAPNALLNDIQKQYHDFDKDVVGISRKWDPRTLFANAVAWSCGVLTVILFLASLVTDVCTGVSVKRAWVTSQSNGQMNQAPGFDFSAPNWRPSPLKD